MNLRRGTFASECEEFKLSERQTRTDGRTPLQRAARVALNVRVSLGGRKNKAAAAEGDSDCCVSEKGDWKNWKGREREGMCHFHKLSGRTE